MDAILSKFTGKIDARSVIKTVEEIKVQYIDDGLTKEDLPPILAKLMMQVSKFNKLGRPGKEASRRGDSESPESVKSTVTAKRTPSLKLS